jgi:kinesin family protein C1
VLDITSSANKDVTGCKTAPEKKFNWKFDKVFGPDSTQSKVFEEISQLVQSALDGYNTCIFAYGQTGSGKYDKLKMTAHWTNLTTMLYRTFTMEGPPAAYLNNDTRGMISRAVEQIFLTSYKLAEKGWEYEMQASFVEIYNESVRDLLASKKANEDTKYEIKHDPTTGKTWVTNLTVVPVRSPERVEELLKLSSKNRAVGVTNMNERSSRSHSVFQLRLIGKNKHTDAKSEGILNLIDLAGSERLAQSGATGDRLKETQAINKSLSCLGDVIAALANKDKHIPYRNSKLTFLLQDSLGGNSKTLMFVNISPASSNLNESIKYVSIYSHVGDIY